MSIEENKAAAGPVVHGILPDRTAPLLKRLGWLPIRSGIEKRQGVAGA